MSKEQIKISVTASHISMGCAMDGRNCPIALAIRDIVGHDKYVAVGIVSAAIDCDPKCNSHRLSDNLSQFVRDFDAKREVKPIEGTLIPIE